MRAINVKKIISAILTLAMALLFTVAFSASVNAEENYEVYTTAQTDDHLAKVTSYTYEVIPLLAPFNGYVYVKTDNPDPSSFRFIDKSSKYRPASETFIFPDAIFYQLQVKLEDVEYEDESIFRVKGGYIFEDSNNRSDGGELVLQARTRGDALLWDNPYGWEDTAVTIPCPELKTYEDYLIDTYTKDSMGFFEKLDAVESALSSLAVYPSRVLDSSKPNQERPYPFFASSPYAELSLNKHVDVYEYSEGGLLLSKVYPFVLDSASYPLTMRNVAKELDINCDVESVPGAHWLIDVTQGETTKTYGYGCPYGGESFFTRIVKKDYVFDNSSNDFGRKGSIEKLRARYLEYKTQARLDNEVLYKQLSGEEVSKVIGSGSWAIVAVENSRGYGETYAYLSLGADNNSYNVASNAWVDGRYVDNKERLVLGETFDQHPTANIIVRAVTYFDAYGAKHTGDIIYSYDSGTDTWTALDYYDPYRWDDEDTELPAQFILTREQVKAMNLDRNTNTNPTSGVVYNGKVPTGTKFDEAFSGWQKRNGKWYFCNNYGIIQIGWVNDGGKWYYMGLDGAMRRGWQQVDGLWYYMGRPSDPDSGSMATGWVHDGSNWYYMNASGVMQTGWVKSGGAWYYLKASGKMATGWVHDGSSWYYMNSSGAMQTGWIQSGGAWYYLKSSGAMAANEYIGGYWLNGNGSWTYPYKATWRKSGNRWWYGDATGWYAKNGTYKIDGTVYTFDAAGWMK